MNALLNYTLEANICLLLFLGGYHIFLAREKNFRVLRFVLLFAIIGSLTLPIIHFETGSSVSLPTLSSLISDHWLPTINVSSTESITKSSSLAIYTWLDVMYVIYGVGFLIALTGTAIRIYQILHLISIHHKVKLGHYTLIETTASLPTFSFFHWIFIGSAGTLTEREKQQIIRHETVHANQLHSADILLTAFIGIIFWFNPFIKVYRNYLVQVHEFEADEKTIDQINTNEYCSLLAKVALHSNFHIANHFSQSMTLRRIEMMRSEKDKFKRWKLAPMLLLLVSCGVVIACHDQISERKRILPTNDDEQIFMVVEHPAEPIGGFDALKTFIRNNLVYSKNAVDNNIKGTVYIAFIVNKDGSISDPKILRGIDRELDAEALRVVRLLPAWKPGRQNDKEVRQRFTLPIKFDKDCSDCDGKDADEGTADQ